MYVSICSSYLEFVVVCACQFINDRKGVHKLICTNCKKFYIGRTNRNFNTRFKEHRKDFRCAECKLKFSKHVLKEGHEMKTIKETTSIIHLENSHRKINMLEEIKILEAASSKYLWQNDPMYKLLPSLVIWTPIVNSPGQATKEISKPNY